MTPPAVDWSSGYTGSGVGEPRNLVGRNPFQPLHDPCPVEGQSAHVTDVKEADPLPDRLMLLDDRRILYRHRPSAKLHQATTV